VVFSLALTAALVLGLILAAAMRAWYGWRYSVSLRLRNCSLEGRKDSPGRNMVPQRKLLSRLVLARFAPRRLASHYAPILEQADIPLRGEEMAGATFFSVAIGAALGLLALGILGALLGGLFGYLLPGLLLKNHLARRLRAAEEQLEEFLSFVANAMRAGSSLMQAMDLAGRTLPSPLGREMRRTQKEISLGVSMDDAWQNLVKRVPSGDMDLVATAVLIQRQVGGDLAGILDSIAATIRERQRVKAQVRTLTAQGRLSGFVIASLPFVLFVLFSFINPAYVRLLWTEPLGLLMLGMGLVSQVVGTVLISRIIRIDV